MENIINLSTAVEKFLFWKGADKPTAPYAYKHHLRNFVEFLEDKILSGVTDEDIIRFRYSLDDKYKPKTIQLAMIAVKGVFRYCNLKKLESLSHELVRVPKADTYNSYVPTTRDDYERLKAACSRETLREIQQMLILMMLWDTGMRVSELCRMDIAHIDTLNRRAVIVTKKAKQQRVVKWSEETNRVLCEYLGMRICLNRHTALFVGLYIDGINSSERMSSRCAERALERLGIKIGLPYHFSPHCLRHAWTHDRLLRGAELSFVSNALGHKRIESTATYARRTNLELENKLEEYLVKMPTREGLTNSKKFASIKLG